VWPQGKASSTFGFPIAFHSLKTAALLRLLRRKGRGGDFLDQFQIRGRGFLEVF